MTLISFLQTEPCDGGFVAVRCKTKWPHIYAASEPRRTLFPKADGSRCDGAFGVDSRLEPQGSSAGGAVDADAERISAAGSNFARFFTADRQLSVYSASSSASLLAAASHSLVAAVI